MRSFLFAAGLAILAQPASAAIRSVHAGDDLQAAINGAQPGDEIRLDAGVTFTGNFTLPAHAGTDFITIRTALPDGTPPVDGQRVTPAMAAAFAKIVSPNSASALRTAPGAHHWRIMLLEFPPNRDGYGDIIQIGDGSSAQNQLAQVPHAIVLDRLYVHGDPLTGQKRGIALNGSDVTIRNSRITDIKAYGIDAQAIGGWNGPGPFDIQNNYLEASTEIFLLGGSDPAIPNLVSTGVIFRHNYLSRPLAWRDPIIAAPAGVTGFAGSGGSLAAGTYLYRVVARRGVGQGSIGHSLPSAQAAVTVGNGGAATVTWSPVPNASEYQVYGRTTGGATQYWTVTGTTFTDTGAPGTGGTPPSDGSVWQVKNIFELKNARDVTVEFNVFENNWQAAQPGYAIVLTPRNQDGACTWCVVENVTFQHNVLRNTAAGFNILGYDSPHPSQQANGLVIRDNLVYAVSQQYGGNGWGMLIGDEPRNITIDHNTFDHDGTTVVYIYGGSTSAPRTITGFQFTNNVARHNAYGLNGAGTSPGMLTIQTYLPGAVVTGNWLSGGSASRYPAGNRFESPFASYVENISAADYRLIGALASPCADGKPAGADVGALTAMAAQVVVSAAPGPQAPRNVRIIRSAR